MTQLPVAELVRQNSNNLFRFALLNQGVVDNNVLLPGQTKEVGVAVSAALASINDEQLVKGEVELLSQGLGLSLKLAFLQGR